MKHFSVLLWIILPFLLLADVTEIKKENPEFSDKEIIEKLLDLAKNSRYYGNDEAIKFGNEALSLSQRSKEYELEVLSYISLSQTYKRISDGLNSRANADSALELANKTGDDKVLSEALKNSVIIYVRFNNFKIGFNYCTQLLDLNYRKGNDFVSDAYSSMGNIFLKIGNYSKAIEYHEMALDVCKKNKCEDDVYRLVMALGIDYRYLGDLETSLVYFMQLKEIISPRDVSQYARTLNHIGNNYLRMKKYDLAMDYCDQAKHYFSKTDKNHGKGDIDNDIARIYYETGNTEKALEFNFKALEYRKEIKRTNLVASSYRNIADIFRETKKHKKAEDYYRRSLEIAVEINNLALIEYVHEKMSVMYKEQKKYVQAIQSYEEYLEVYKTLYSENLQTEMLNEQYNAEITAMEKENSILRKMNSGLFKEVDIQNKIQIYFKSVLTIAVLLILSLLYIYIQKRMYSTKLQKEVAVKTSELSDSRQVLKNVNVERKMLKSDLENLRYTYENLVQNLGEGVAIVSTNEEFLAVNPAAEEIFGTTPNNLVGKNLKDFLDLEETEKINNQTQSRINSEISTYDLTINRLYGGERTVIVTATPIKDEAGKLISVLGIFRDITDRKKDEIKIKEMLHEKSELLQEVQHRVRNNLQFVTSILRMLYRSNQDGKVKHFIQHFQTRVFVISHIHKCLEPDSTHLLDFVKYITDVRDNVMRQIQTRDTGIVFDINIAEKFININYAIPLGMVINELISNSIIHAFKETENGKIVLKYYWENDENILEYSDNGQGIKTGFDFSECKSFGMQMVNFQNIQLKGKLETDFTNGFRMKLTFKNIHLKTFTEM